MEESHNVKIDAARLTEFLYTELTDMGYAITGDEAFDIVDIVIDFLILMMENAGVQIMLEDEEDDNATS